jgi:dTDP-4-amino-4,6-dideoxy-D-galactose acyltransferase
MATAITQLSPCRKLPWDSAHFGMRIGTVQASLLTRETASEIEEWLLLNPVDCLYFLAEPEPETMRVASQHGFRFVDGRVTLEANARPTETPSGVRLAGVRLANDADLPELCRIAGTSHRNTRFYTDGGFAPEACDRLYQLWITNGLRDGAVFVVDCPDGLAGYISISASDGVGHISLIAVDAASRRGGLASRLMQAASGWFLAKGVERIRVPTQIANVPALRLYEAHGFKVSAIQFWYHRWL